MTRYAVLSFWNQLLGCNFRPTQISLAVFHPLLQSLTLPSEGSTQLQLHRKEEKSVWIICLIWTPSAPRNDFCDWKTIEVIATSFFLVFWNMLELKAYFVLFLSDFDWILSYARLCQSISAGGQFFFPGNFPDWSVLFAPDKDFEKVKKSLGLQGVRWLCFSKLFCKKNWVFSFLSVFVHRFCHEHYDFALFWFFWMGRSRSPPCRWMANWFVSCLPFFLFLVCFFFWNVVHVSQKSRMEHGLGSNEQPHPSPCPCSGQCSRRRRDIGAMGGLDGAGIPIVCTRVVTWTAALEFSDCRKSSKITHRNRPAKVPIYDCMAAIL